MKRVGLDDNENALILDANTTRLLEKRIDDESRCCLAKASHARGKLMDDLIAEMIECCCPVSGDYTLLAARRDIQQVDQLQSFLIRRGRKNAARETNASRGGLEPAGKHGHTRIQITAVRIFSQEVLCQSR